MSKMGRPRTSDDHKRITGTWRADRHLRPRQSTPKGAFPKREEAEAWSELFSCGHDGFCDAQTLLGLDKYEVNFAAGDAWRRLGKFWLSEIWPGLGHPCAIVPWAVSTFGKPWLDE